MGSVGSGAFRQLRRVLVVAFGSSLFASTGVVAQTTQTFVKNVRDETTGLWDFNASGNWNPAGPPTGIVAFTSSAVAPVSFTQATTTLAGISQNASSLFLRRGQTLTMTGQGLVMTASDFETAPSFWMTADGSGALPVINGNVVMNDVSPDGSGAVRLSFNGNGTINGNVAVNAGTLLVMNNAGPATLTINGNYSQGAPGSTSSNNLFVVVNPNGTDWSRLIVSGTAAIASNQGRTTLTVRASGQGSDPFPNSKRMTFLTAAGGVSGQFSNVVVENPLIKILGVDYRDPTAVTVIVARDFGSSAVAPHFQSLGNALAQASTTPSPELEVTLGNLATISPEQIEYTLNQLSGRGYAAFGTLGVQTGQAFMNTISQQLGAFRTSYGATGRVALAEACDVACEAEPRLGAWISGIGGVGSVLGSFNTGGAVTYNLGGVAAGIDYRLDRRALVGLSVGYGSGNVWTNGFDGKGWSNSYNVSLYGGFNSGGVYVDALAGYANNQNQMKRNIAIPDFTTFVAQGQSYANQFLGQVETGYRFGIYAPAEASLTPFARLQGSTNNQAAFNETGGGGVTLNVAQQTTNSLRSTLGVDLAGAIDLGWREKLAVRLRLGWQHEYADVARPVTAAFAGAPTLGFTVYGAAPPRDAAVLGLAVDTAIAAGTNIYLRYDGDVGGGTNNNVLSAGLRMTW